MGLPAAAAPGLSAAAAHVCCAKPATQPLQRIPAAVALPGPRLCRGRSGHHRQHPGQMSFTFASPTQVYFNEANVKQVDVPTQSGAFGILAALVPTLQVLKPGVVTVHAEDGTTTKYFVSSSSVTVKADSSVQLLAEEAVTLDMLDVAAARSNLEKVHSDLSGASDEAARAEVQIRIEANEAIVKALES